MGFYLELHTASNIQRNDEGVPYSWWKGNVIERFKNPTEFMDYVRANVRLMSDVVAFTGSARTIQNANVFIASELKKAGLLK